MMKFPFWRVSVPIPAPGMKTCTSPTGPPDCMAVTRPAIRPGSCAETPESGSASAMNASMAPKHV